MNKTSRGFTLIELLVVIAIIGVLASVVLSSLGSARNKSKDGSLKEAGAQLRSMMELNYSDYGDYANLTTNTWISSSGGCDSYFAGTYASKVREICKNIISNAQPAGPLGDYRLFIGVAGVDTSKYSILIWLPSKQRYFCIGSSGQNSDTSDGNTWVQPGCYSNP